MTTLTVTVPDSGPGDRRLPGVTHFEVAEGAALDVLAVLLNRGRGDLITAPVRLDAPRKALLEAGARRIALSVMRYLAEGDGAKERTFLRAGQRVTGRVWDARLGEGFAPRYTRASRSLWLEGARHLPAMASAVDATAANDPSRKGAKLLKEVVETDGTASGDWVFYAIAHQSVRSFQLGAQDEITLLRRLRMGSPLALLLHPDPAANAEDMRGAFARLADPTNARVAECLERRLERAWVEAASKVWNARQMPADLTTRWGALGRTLHAWLDAIDRARRMDLARPLLRFAAALMPSVIRVPGEEARKALSSVSGLRTLQDRDALLAAAALAGDVGVRLLRMRDTLAAERYGDERYEEAQVYLRDADRVLAPRRRDVEGLARALSGIIG